jgi:hypothetical protein
MTAGVVVAILQYGGWRYFQSLSFIHSAVATILQYGG